MDGHPPPVVPRRLSLVLPAYNEEAGIRQAVAEADDALSALACAEPTTKSSSSTTAAATPPPPSSPTLAASGRASVCCATPRTAATAPPCAPASRPPASTWSPSPTPTASSTSPTWPRLLPLTDDAPVAVGYRLDRQDPWLRRFLSRGYNLLARTLLGTGVRDCDCALKVFRREALAELLPETGGFFVNTEMLARARQRGCARGRGRRAPSAAPARAQQGVAARGAAHAGRAAAVLVVARAVRRRRPRRRRGGRRRYPSPACC